MNKYTENDTKQVFYLFLLVGVLYVSVCMYESGVSVSCIHVWITVSRV